MASPNNPAEGPAVPYVLDPGKSRFQVRATATGLLSAFGHSPTIAIRDFKGEAWFPPHAPEQASLCVEIAAASLTVTGDAPEKDRQEMERAMREEVLETSRFPAIRFASSGIQSTKISDGLYRMKIAGNLTLHGVERDLEIPGNVTIGDADLRVNGEFSIRQTDYGIKPVSAAGGTIKLKDELKFNFDITGSRRKD